MKLEKSSSSSIHTSGIPHERQPYNRLNGYHQVWRNYTIRQDVRDIH